MSGSLFWSRWLVEKRGYRWVDAVPRRDGAEELLSPVSGVPVREEHAVTWDEKPSRFLEIPVIKTENLSTRYKVYDPRSKPALFRNFAELEPTEDAIQRFANEYGPLGLFGPIEVQLEHGGKTFPNGEQFEVWVREIRHMRQAVNALEALEQALYAHDGRPELAPYVAEDDEIKRLRSFIQSSINRKLDQHAAPRLLYDPDQGTMGLRIVPKNLLGAMWLQFGEAIDSTRKFDRCKQCNSWFAISKSERTNRLFCSDACKSKHYRKRKERTIELFSAGYSVEEIVRQLESEQLDTDERTVRRWIGREGK